MAPKKCPRCGGFRRDLQVREERRAEAYSPALLQRRIREFLVIHRTTLAGEQPASTARANS